MNLLYTLRAAFDSGYDEDGDSWHQYKRWSRLQQLTELVSLDALLNETLVLPDYNNAADWEEIHVLDFCVTGFYHSEEYVLRKALAEAKFNLLAVAIAPEEACECMEIPGYEFVGYDLLDRNFKMSVLTNCGGFDQCFLPTDLNQYGLIDHYQEIQHIQERLRANGAYCSHTHTHVFAVWRHRTIGR